MKTRPRTRTVLVPVPYDTPSVSDETRTRKQKAKRNGIFVPKNKNKWGQTKIVIEANATSSKAVPKTLSVNAIFFRFFGRYLVRTTIKF